MKKIPSKNTLFYIFLCFLILAQLSISFFFLSNTSIDNDDMCQLEVSISESLPRILELLLETDNNPPLFTLLAAIWVRIIPYGSGNLKLLSQLFLVASTALMGIYTKRISGYISAITTSVMTATSTILVYCCADVFRPYGLLFFTGTLTLCAYLHRRRHNEDIASMLLYFFAITAMAYTHYFGILTCLALFIFDTVLFFLKKLKIQTISTYIGAGICYIPWLIPVVKVKFATAGSFWPVIPSIKSLYTNCYSKYFDSNINLVVFLIFLIILFKIHHDNRKTLKKTKLHPEESYPEQINPNYDFTFEYLLLCLWVPFFVTILDFIYSKFINPAGSMWVERYFIVVYPFSFLLIGISWGYLLDLWIDKWDFTLKKYLPYLILIAFLLLQGHQFYSMCKYVGTHHEHPFEQACNDLVAREDFFEETTGFLPTFNHQKKAYNYFFTHKGKRDIPTFQWVKFPVKDETKLEAYNTIYLLEIFIDLDDTTKQILEEQFNLVEEANQWGISKWIRRE